MAGTDGTVQTVGVFQPLLGTDIEIRVTADTLLTARSVEQAAVSEIERLTTVFSIFDPASAISRWRSDRSDDMPDELAWVLAQAEHWWRISGGAFHPASAGLRRRWLQAQDAGRLPGIDEMAQLAHDAAQLPFAVEHHRDDSSQWPLPGAAPDGPAPVVSRVGDCSDVDLNAIAKGFIVDAAVRRGMARRGAVAITVNAGGDLRHDGEGSIRVGVEDPLRPSVNSPRLDVVELSRSALATSGGAHRGFHVEGRRFSHVIDPRTGWPVEHTSAATVCADTALLADAAATVTGVLDAPEAVDFADRHELGLLHVGAPDPAVPPAGGTGVRVARSRCWRGAQVE